MKIKPQKEDYKVTFNDVTYTVRFIIWRAGHEIDGYLYLEKKCLHYWPKIKEANQAAAALLVHEYLKKQTETIIK